MIEDIKKLAKEHDTPILIIDHEIIRKNYKEFLKNLPRVQPYYAVKANSEPEIIKTLYNLGASFDVASLPEFNLIYDVLRTLKCAVSLISHYLIRDSSINCREASYY